MKRPTGASEKIIAVIPARYGSTRLEGKPLLKETGKYLIQHVYEAVKKSRIFTSVIVATDDKRIYNACRKFGAEVVMTSSKHKSGTDRIAEAVRGIDCDIVINVQGDEPLITAAALKKLTGLFDKKSVVMATLANKSRSKEDLYNTNVVKIVLDRKGYAALFTRMPVTVSGNGGFYRHIGVYGYTKEFLLKFTKMKQTPGEIKERLEQLRALENGCKIKVGITKYQTLGIDTREDYEKFMLSYSRT